MKKFIKNACLLVITCALAILAPSLLHAGELIGPTEIEGMVFVKGGCFEMGDTFGDGDPDERPAHTVCVDDFYMGAHEVTRGEFREFVRDAGYRTDAEKGEGCLGWTGEKWGRRKGFYWDNAGFSQTDTHPVVCVSWNDTQEYIRWKGRKTGRGYRLPNEAEWEYAARSGGKKHKYSWGNGSPSGNIADEAAKRQFSGWTIWDSYDDGHVYTAPVGSFSANEVGLYDMTGNVWEWVGDWYGGDYYKKSPRDNPRGPSSGEYRVLRGGSWYNGPGLMRSADRSSFIPSSGNCYSGFRSAFGRSSRE